MVFDFMKFPRQKIHGNLENWPTNLTGTRKCALGAWKDLSLFILPCILGLKPKTQKKSKSLMGFEPKTLPLPYDQIREFRVLEFYYYLQYLQVIIILHKGTLQGK